MMMYFQASVREIWCFSLHQKFQSEILWPVCDTEYLAWLLMALFLLAMETCSVKGSQSQRNWVNLFWEAVVVL